MTIQSDTAIREAMVAGYGEEYVAMLEKEYLRGKLDGNAESDKWHSAIFNPGVGK